MSRNNYGGPKLPRHLLDQVTDGRISKRNQQLSRKDQRKAERVQKKQIRSRPTNVPSRTLDRPSRQAESTARRRESVPVSETVRPDPSTNAPPSRTVGSSSQASESKSPDGNASGREEEVDESEDDYSRAPKVSKGVKARLEEDDSEIARLEKKLGIKKGRKKVGDDELDWLVSGGLSDEDEERFHTPKLKRTAPEDNDWLKQKRRKANQVEESEEDESEEEELEEVSGNEGKDEDIEGSLSGLENPFSEDELSEDGFGGDSESEHDPPPKKERENPYVAPTSKNAASAGNYIPPSLRKAASTDEELLKQLRRQFQGQLNRLSEEKLLSILEVVVEVYSRNARQHCTSVLVELFRDLICDPSALNETFLILHAGFAAALYRTIGTDFGAQLLEAIVEAFDRHHAQQSEGKQTLNLLAFLSNLYALQAMGCDIMFDYIKMLLDNFSEGNTELLLRVIRVSGQQLRLDDPTSLKGIVLLLQRAIAAAGGEAKVSVRTKFMIETIHNLKNNRLKNNAGLGAVAAEHLQRIKKKLGTIKSVKTKEPLRISLADIRGSEKKGKWWLVGASWKDPTKMANDGQQSTATVPVAKTSNEDEDDRLNDADSDIDLNALARKQGMNTDIRRAIFISVTGAVDPQHAFLRVQKLNLKNKQQLEIPRVLLHCVGAEPVYNHFYTLVALRYCGDRKLKKAYQFALFDILRRCGEDTEDNSDDEEDRADEMTIRQVYNTAKLYATLIAEDQLRLSILRSLRFTALKPKTGILVEVLLSTVFILLRKKHGKAEYEQKVKDAFSLVHAVDPALVKGLGWFLETVIPDKDVTSNKKERKVVLQGAEYALEALRDERQANSGKLADDGDNEDDDAEGMEISWD